MSPLSTRGVPYADELKPTICVLIFNCRGFYIKAGDVIYRLAIFMINIADVSRKYRRCISNVSPMYRRDIFRYYRRGVNIAISRDVAHKSAIFVTLVNSI